MTRNDVRHPTRNNTAGPDSSSGRADRVFPDVPGLPSYSSDQYASSRSCPPWCMNAHIDELLTERIHNAWIQSVDLNAIPLAGLPQRLWLDLVLGHGDDEPRIHLQIDDRFPVELTLAEARSAGMHLIGLAALGVMDIPPASSG